MNQPDTTQLLNQLLGVTCRSFPQYLKFSRPYIPSGREDVMGAIDAIVADQDALADRLGQMILDREALPREGEFSMEFTDMHDLGIDYLIGAAQRYQQQDIATIERLIEALQFAPAAKSLAQEALGMAKGHLDSLRELMEPSEPAKQ